MIQDHMSDVKILIFYSMLAFFGIFGIFGNMMIIVASYRKKTFRTKIGLLITITTYLHMVCLLSEISGAVNNWRFHVMGRDVCFKKISPYLFALNMQSGMFFVMSLDILLSIAVPLRHRFWPRNRYVMILCIPPFIFALVSWIICYLHVSTEEIRICAPPTVLLKDDARWILLSILGMSLVSIIFAVIEVTIVYNRGDKSIRASRHSGKSDEHKNKISEEKKVLRSITTLCLIFIGSWGLCILLSHLLIQYGDVTNNEASCKLILVFLALLTYSQNFYYIYFRHVGHRRVFQQQINFLTCGMLFKESLKNSFHSTEKRNQTDSLRNGRTNNIVAASNENGPKRTDSGLAVADVAVTIEGKLTEQSILATLQQVSKV